MASTDMTISVALRPRFGDSTAYMAALLELLVANGDLTARKARSWLTQLYQVRVGNGEWEPLGG